MSAQQPVTMEGFRKACENRLNHAVQINETGLELCSNSLRLETTNGLLITRYVGKLMSVECDFSDLAEDTDLLKTRVEFYDNAELPTTVTIELLSETGVTNLTLERADYDRVATELSKYVTLEM